MPTESELQLEGQPIAGQASTQLQSSTAHAFDLYKLGVFVNGNIGFGHKEETEQESGFDFNTIGLTLERKEGRKINLERKECRKINFSFQECRKINLERKEGRKINLERSIGKRYIKNNRPHF